ncbi:MAG: aminotransferase class I/II-fold pyridoxal phosphate-dependent enzyme [Lachnospiraceae bacterium]|nr:aminotransferase class I/II-fold pyridoxal phosphate-dependent enzyme [Lachnospiraceae bacterium]
MQALILAAGMGKRLKDLTSDKTKCMVRVNGVTLIERMLGQLEKLDLERIVIVVGYKGEYLKSFIDSLGIRTPIVFVNNDIYDRTNNIYSLALAKEYLLEKDTLLFESDLIFEDDVLRLLLEDPRDTLALVDKYESWMNGTVVKLSDADEITAFIPGNKFVFEDIPQYYKTVNIYKFSKKFSQNQYVPFLESYLKALGNNEYYEQVLRVLTLLDNSWIRAKRIEGKKWYEIDDIQDLDIAASIFTESNDRLDKLQSRYGGYWRYPKLLDFCYLVNPYFPPRRMLSEIKANADKLIMNYPSGARVNALLAAKNFSVREEQIVVGNGAAELIKSIMENQAGNIGFIRPTFEEYPNRRRDSSDVVFEPANDDFSYNAEDLISYFGNKDITMLVLINPDNPTGNYIEKKEILRLAAWCQEKDIKFLLDESFVDFAVEKDSSLIQENILSQYDNLLVVKSISKSYGVPGLRLGVLASGDTKLIRQVKSDISIWNINSFAEFYMQIEEKYKKDYSEALELFKDTRNLFIQELEKISWIRVIPSQANYVMCELSGRYTAKEIATKLLSEYNILIKDLSEKLKGDRQFIRIAIRTREENAQLIKALGSL